MHWDSVSLPFEKPGVISLLLNIILGSPVGIFAKSASHSLPTRFAVAKSHIDNPLRSPTILSGNFVKTDALISNHAATKPPGYLENTVVPTPKPTELSLVSNMIAYGIDAIKSLVPKRVSSVSACRLL